MDTAEHSVERYISAPPDVVYRLVSDIERMGDWSPETYKCEWQAGVTQPLEGVKFRAWNRRGFLRWRNTPTVVKADPGREFAFDRRLAGQSAVWRFTMEPSGDGTTLRESYRVSRPTPAPLLFLMARLMRIADREQQLEQDMQSTIARIAAAAEAEAAAAAQSS